MKRVITLIICGALSGTGFLGFGIPKNIDWTSRFNKIIEDVRKEDPKNNDKVLENPADTGKDSEVENPADTGNNPEVENSGDNVVVEEKPDVNTEAGQVPPIKNTGNNNEENEVDKEVDKPSTTVKTPPEPTTPVEEVSNTSPAPETPVSTGDFSAQVEQLIFTRVNQERAKAGVSTLSYSSLMENYARIKSQDMGDRNYFDHKNLEGELITSQMNRDGVTYGAWGENIAYIGGVTDLNQLADQFMTNWMNSPGHKANILSKNFTSIGVGVYKSGNRYYATQEFYK